MSEKTTDLVARAKQGDSAAFEALYIEYKDRLTKFVMKKGLPEQDAEDIVSDTFVEVMKHIQDLDNNEFFGTWIHRIALNKANLFHNRQNRMQRASFDTQDSLDSGLDKIDGETAAIEQAYESEYGDTVMLPSDYAENEDTKRIIAEQINSLSDEHKEALVLFYYENRSINEIAEMTGTNPNNVKARLFNARKNLRKKLETLQKKGIVLCAVPISSIVPVLKGGVIGAIGTAGSAAAATSTAASSSVASSSAASSSVASSSAASSTMASSSAASSSMASSSAASSSMASSSAASSTVAGAAKAAVGAAEAGTTASAVGGAGAAAGASAAVGLKIAAVAIAATVAVGAAAAGIVIHNRDKGTEIDAEVRDASESEESEEETEPAIPAAASEAESEAEPEKKPYVLRLDGEEIEIDFTGIDYRAWEEHWDENDDFRGGYILLKDAVPEYTGRWLLAKLNTETRTITPVESAEPTENDDRYCTIDDSCFSDEPVDYAFHKFFDAGKALFVEKDHWIAVFPDEGRIDIHPMSFDEPKENWYYGLPINDEGDLYDGTYESPFKVLRVASNDSLDGPRPMGSDGLLTPDNQEMEKQPDIDPETLRPIVDTSSLEKPKAPEELTGWKKALYDRVNEYAEQHSDCEEIKFWLVDINGDGTPELKTYAREDKNVPYESIIYYDENNGVVELEYCSPDNYDGYIGRIGWYYPDLLYTGKSNVIKIYTTLATGARGATYRYNYYEIKDGQFVKLDHEVIGHTVAMGDGGYDIDGVEGYSYEEFLKFEEDLMGGSANRDVETPTEFKQDQAFDTIVNYDELLKEKEEEQEAEQ